MRRANIISGGLLAVICAIVLFAVIPWQIDEGPAGMMSPRLVPSMMMIAVIALSLLLVFTNLKPDPESKEYQPSPFSRAEMLALLKIGGVFALAIALYLWLSPLAAGAALIIGTLLVLGERRPLVIILMPSLLLFGIWALFYKVLGTAIV